MGILLDRIISPIAKALNRQVGIRGADPRKGNFQWMAQLPSKKVLKPVIINSYTLKQLSNTDPITWAIKATRKAQVTQTDWDIVRDTEKLEQELDRWHTTIISNLNPWGFEEAFHPSLVDRDLYIRASNDIKKILQEATVDNSVKKQQLKWYFESLKRKVRQDADEHAAIVRKIFEKPNNSETPNFRAFLELLVDDILTYDSGVIVKNANSLGELAEMYLLPGQDVKLYRNPDRTIPTPPDYAYVWEDQGVLRAEFTRDEVVYIMSNPQQNGYGMSPLEVSAYIITASLYADEYNIDFFKHSNIPPAIINLGKNITQEQRKQFQTNWDNEVAGRGLHKMMFVSGTEGTEYVAMRTQSSRDMQMMEYLKWTLNVKCACFQISPQDISFISDYHRSTGETQKEITKERGIMNLLSLLETYFNTEIVKKCFPFQDVMFQWQGLDLQDEKIQSDIDAADIKNGVISRNDRRKRIGLQPIDGGDTILVETTQGTVRIEDLMPPEEDQEEEEQPITQAQDGKDTEKPEDKLVPIAQQKQDPKAVGKDKAAQPEDKDKEKEAPASDEEKKGFVRMIVNSLKQDKITKAMANLKKEGLGEEEVRITMEEK
ncbi:MAG: phage portal protein [Gallionella sp.]|jgi:HK97 family phage portal protein